MSPGSSCIFAYVGQYTDAYSILTAMQVFCLSKNKLTKLPHYMTQMNKLEVLKVDKNPITYPPKHVLEPGEGATGQDMVDWVESVQRFLFADSPRKASVDSASTSSTDLLDDSRDSLQDTMCVPCRRLLADCSHQPQ